MAESQLMVQSRESVRRVVLDVLRDLVGPEDGRLITDKTRPIGDLDLASVDGFEFALEVEERLGLGIDQTANPLVDDDRHKARTVGEVVEWLCGLAKAADQE